MLTSQCRAGFLSVVKMINVHLDDSSIACLSRPLIHCNRSIRELNLVGSLDAVSELGYVSLSQMLLTNDALQRMYVGCFSLKFLDGMAVACSKCGHTASSLLPRISAALHFEIPPLGGMICVPAVNDATAAAAAVLINCAAALVGMYCNVSMVSSSSKGYAWLLQANAQRPNNVTIYLKSVRTADETLQSSQRWYFSVLSSCLLLTSHFAGPGATAPSVPHFLQTTFRYL